MDTPNAVEPLAARPSASEREVVRLEARLAPCSVDEAMLTILPMVDALRVPENADERTFTAAFRLVVHRYPLWVIREAVASFIAGEVAAHLSPFCPNSAVFGRELGRRLAGDQAKLAIARRQAEDDARLAAEPKPIPRSNEARARGEAQAKRLRELADADRVMRREAHRGAMSRAEIERRRGRGE